MLTPRYSRALQFAFDLHQTELSQTRKGGGIPYVAHLLAVSGLVMEYGGNEDEAIAALLHDAAEDGHGRQTLQQIRENFGEEVAAIVEAVSDTEERPKTAWRARKERYIAHARAASPSARLVSACDKLHNLRSIEADYRAVGEDLWSRFVREEHDLDAKRAAVLWYYRSLTEVYLEAGPQPVGEELERTLGRLEVLLPRFAPGQFVTFQGKKATDVFVAVVQHDRRSCVLLEMLDLQEGGSATDWGVRFDEKPFPVPDNALPCPEEWEQAVREIWREVWGERELPLGKQLPLGKGGDAVEGGGIGFEE